MRKPQRQVKDDHSAVVVFYNIFKLIVSSVNVRTYITHDANTPSADSSRLKQTVCKTGRQLLSSLSASGGNNVVDRVSREGRCIRVLFYVCQLLYEPLIIDGRYCHVLLRDEHLREFIAPRPSGVFFPVRVKPVEIAVLYIPAGNQVASSSSLHDHGKELIHRYLGRLAFELADPEQRKKLIPDVVICFLKRAPPLVVCESRICKAAFLSVCKEPHVVLRMPVHILIHGR